MSQYIEMKYIKKDTVEKREYQLNLATQAARENCIVVLPTGLGKTAVALQVMADYLVNGTRAVLFLAPTRVLVNQHYEFLQKTMTIDDISMVTGEDLIPRRKKIWHNSSILCATPEITNNDLRRGLITPAQFGLVIFDEVHRTVGDYAYSGIAEQVRPASPRILGMTATLPSDRERATEILARLRISSVAERTEESPDVIPYTQETKTEWFKVELTTELKTIQALLKTALGVRYNILKSNNAISGDQQSLSGLLRIRDYVLKHDRRSAKSLFTAIRIHYALNILEAHGITPFLKFCERTREKKGAGIRELFEMDPNFTSAVRLAERAQSRGIEHPKVIKLAEVLREISGKVLIFTSYRDSVNMISEELAKMNITSGILIGKAGQTGLKQKDQIETVRRFRDGEFRILVATRVGEEGLDIAEVNHVIFYDNVPSSIRYVQRRGRTGRKDTGRLIVLMAKGTIDEVYYWIGKRKIKAAESMSNTMSNMLERNKNKESQSQAPLQDPVENLDSFT